MPYPSTYFVHVIPLCTKLVLHFWYVLSTFASTVSRLCSHAVVRLHLVMDTSPVPWTYPFGRLAAIETPSDYRHSSYLYSQIMLSAFVVWMPSPHSTLVYYKTGVATGFCNATEAVHNLVLAFPTNYTPVELQYIVY